MRAMIMAAGLGTRLMPLTSLRPKPMVPVLGTPVVGHILSLLSAHDIHQVVMNLHHVPSAITGYFGAGGGVLPRIFYSYEPELLGTAGGVKRNEEFLTEEGTFLVVSGDALTDIDLTSLVEAHRTSGALATLAVKAVEDPAKYGVVEIDEENRILAFQEKPRPGEEISHLCNCGIYVLEAALLDYVPPGRFCDFGKDIWPSVLRAGGLLRAYPVTGYWNDIGDQEAYRRGNVDALLGRVLVEKPALQHSPGVWVGPQARVDEGAVVEPPVFLGGGCQIEAGSRIVGPTVLGAHSLVEEGACVADTVAWDGVFFGRGSRIEHCLIGTACRFQGWVAASDCVFGERCLVGDIGSLVGFSVDAGTVLWQ